MTIELISNADLRSDKIPPPDAKWMEFTHFALSIAGYSFPCTQNWGEILKQPSGRTLTELRVCLFMLQRAIRWTCQDPEYPEDAFQRDHARINAVLDEIRTRIANREID